MTFMLFEKNETLYHFPVRLPLNWKPIPFEKLEHELKALDDALESFNESTNATWDRITSDTALFHALQLKNSVRFIYSDLKWSFFVKALDMLGFSFVGISSSPEGFPLEGVR